MSKINNDEHNPVSTVGELKKAIADLPDDMPVGKWDGDHAMIYSWVNGAASTVYNKGGAGADEDWSIYGGYDDDNPEPTKKMLVI